MTTDGGRDDRCEALSERMPAVAAGQADWSGSDLRHLAACDRCGGEWRLVSTAARLGRGEGDALDVERVGARVLERLAAPAGDDDLALRKRWRRIWGAGLAAAAAVALALAARGPAPRAVDVGALRLPVAELDALDAAELEQVLESFDGALGEGRLQVPEGLDELNDGELERVLDSWEG